MALDRVDEYLKNLPSIEENRERIGDNIREREKLRRLLKVAEKEQESKGS